MPYDLRILSERVPLKANRTRFENLLDLIENILVYSKLARDISHDKTLTLLTSPNLARFYPSGLSRSLLNPCQIKEQLS
jgi:hypothetical protein